ncbi:MAG: SRPBCC family protein [Actinomycetota bacterium]|nr:SRPBCC family protein [Actinomycetota bacterium]
MLIENEFTVAAPTDFMWEYLLDVERIAPCMPGAELTEVVDDRNWKGKLNMKFGPVSMSFAGTVTMESRDDAAHRVVLRAKGMEQKGKGAANASVTSWLEPGPSDGLTTVKMQADITLTGAVAQMSRGLLPEISKKLTQQFADCLESSMGAAEKASGEGVPSAWGARGGGGGGGDGSAGQSPPNPRSADTAPSDAPVASKPVGGISLGLSAAWSLIVGFFRRLFGSGGSGSR